jgi:hypothetical protein
MAPGAINRPVRRTSDNGSARISLELTAFQGGYSSITSTLYAYSTHHSASFNLWCHFPLELRAHRFTNLP